MALNQDGFIGEQKAIAFFKSMGYKCFQSDLIVLGKDNEYFMTEVKYQFLFEPPPFYGHGLPPYQVESRLNFYNKTGIRCLFLVFDKNDKDIYCQWLDKLEKGRKIYTPNNKRVIYDINNFNKINA